MPLSGIRVLDLTRLLPGAVCTLQLADMGADVIKVEDPRGGDWSREMPPLAGGQGVIFNAINRNKRSIAIDLRSAPGRDALLRLLESAAVLVEGNRPGVMDRLGLGWEILHQRNPRLVLCSITGYGQDGPMAAAAGHDLNYAAIAGALGLNGTPEGGPLPLGVQVADIGGGGQAAALAIVAALLDVERGAAGRHLDVSMTDVVVTWVAGSLAHATAQGVDAPPGGGFLTGLLPCYRVYRCRDGRYMSVAALEAKFWAALCAALGRPDLEGRRFESGPEVHAALERIFAARPRDEWQALLGGQDACCAPVLALTEVATHPQIAARGLVIDTPTGRQVAPAVRMGEDWRRLPAPSLGQHTAEILAEAGIKPW